jgi:histidinol-phosphate aminotransferase
MSVYWNKRVKNITPYIPGEQPRDKKFIKLNTNENPYPPSPAVIEAVKKAAGEPLRLYPDPACTEMREVVAEVYGVTANQVFAGNGSDEVLAFAFAAFFEGEPALFPDVTYSFYPVYADLWDVPYKTVPLRDDFSIDPNDYLGKSGGVIFPNPNAPTGMALPQNDVRVIAQAAERNGRVLVVDEAYIAFADREGVASALPLLKEFPNILLARTLSKEASLAGLRAGFAIGSEELIEGLCRIRDSFNSYTMDRLALAGAAAAIRDSAYYNEINSRIIATRRRVTAGLEALGFRVLPSQANFLFAAPPGERGKGGGDFFTALRERGILVRHFKKPRTAGFLRISVGTDDDMDVFLEECGKIINC